MTSLVSNLRRGLMACAVLSSSTLALAQPTGSLPPLRGEGAVRYVCGGIGLDESTAFRAAMKDHPLALLFARTDGAYVAEVRVRIEGADGRPVLALRAGGPVCLIDLPAGRYVVHAEVEGEAKQQSVNVGTGSRTADFRFGTKG
ncbi:carboxypeptidase regulatory-like domain-containing protein [Variovorax sp. LT1R16]|uniref:carboxypeptidase regulatory-like domain-containing protein n=1 Tax=Variovorax sp. LT1R16 TaxID=3443728 RepID=UPI003F47F555